MDQLEVMLTEYKELKAEQRARIATRDNLLYATLAVIGLVVAAALRSPSPATMLLALPAATVVLGRVYISNDHKIATIGRYLRDDLAVRIEAVTGAAALGWEWANRLDAGRRVGMVSALAGDLWLFAGTSLTALAIYWHAGPMTIGLVALSVVEALAVASLAAHMLTTYLGQSFKTTRPAHQSGDTAGGAEDTCDAIGPGVARA